MDDLLAGYWPDEAQARRVMAALRSNLDETWGVYLVSGSNGGWVWIHPRTDAEVLHHLWIEHTLLPRHLSRGQCDGE